MKLGLGHSYDDVEYLPEKIRAVIDLSKPASSLGVGFGYLLASIFFHLYYSMPVLPNLPDMIAVALAIFLAHSASQSLNMAEDAEMDRQTPHKQNRPIPSGVVSEDEARTVSWITAGLALALGFLVSWNFGMVLLLLLFFGIFYNLDPIRAKERIISIPWQAASRGLLSFPAVWAAYGDIWEIEPWVLGLFMFWYVMSYQNSADIADRYVDEEHGISTFVVMFGVRGTGYIAVGGTIMMTLTLVASIYAGLIPERFIYMLGILPLCILMLYYMIFRTEDISNTTGNSHAWMLYYITLVVSVFIPLLVEILL
jgi:4-hydroxybenzoate polyprenyltransferase